MRTWYPGILVLTSTVAIPEPLVPQHRPPWFVRAEFGQAEIYGTDRGAWGAVRVGRQVIPSGVLVADVGATGSSAYEGFVTLEVAVEARPLHRAIVTPVLAVGAGGLVAPTEGAGGVLRLSLGLDVHIRRAGFRVALQRGKHWGYLEGPNTLFAGVEYRFGHTRVR